MKTVEQNPLPTKQQNKLMGTDVERMQRRVQERGRPDQQRMTTQAKTHVR